jgi:hypothetical protein
MRLTGSCHCGAVRFSLDSDAPVPYQRCYCSICRKTQGGGGYAINLGGSAATLRVRGRQSVSVYRAWLPALPAGPGEPARRRRRSPAQRHFCSRCGSALWVFDPRWPELLHPFASAIDTPLPVPSEHTHLMLAFKANWAEPAIGERDRTFERYPDESIAEWHQRTGWRERGET